MYKDGSYLDIKNYTIEYIFTFKRKILEEYNTEMSSTFNMTYAIEQSTQNTANACCSLLHLLEPYHSKLDQPTIVYAHFDRNMNVRDQIHLNLGWVSYIPLYKFKFMCTITGRSLIHGISKHMIADNVCVFEYNKQTDPFNYIHTQLPERLIENINRFNSLIQDRKSVV